VNWPRRLQPSPRLALVLVMAWAPAVLGGAWLGDYGVTVITSMLMWMYLCSAWNIIGGFTGQTSFGHSVFFGIGAYTSTYLANTFGVSPWLGMFAGGVLAAFAALVIGYVPFRRNMTTLVFALLTLAASLAFEFLVSGLPQLGGPNGLFTSATGSSLWDMRFEHASTYLWTILALLTLLLLGTDMLMRSRVGIYCRAVRENEHAAAAVGINVYRIKQGVFMLSAFLTAFGGTFYAQHVGFVDPHSVFGLDITIYILLFTIVGGAGTLGGPLLGAAVLVIAGEGLRVALSGSSASGINNLVFGVVLMMAILLYPRGLWHALSGFVRAHSSRHAPKAFQAGSIEVRPSISEPLFPFDGGDLLNVRNICKSFGGVRALHDVSFTVKSGEILGIIGPNGAGKTTLFALLGGFLNPTGGEILFRGERIDALAPDQVCRRGIARTFQIAQTFKNLTAYEVVMTAASVATPEQELHQVAQEILAEVGLTSRQHVVSSQLTLVDQRRLEIARALATRPQVILLDEIMAGLTPKEVLAATELVRRMRMRGITVVIVEHLVKAVMSLSDRMVVLDSGELIKLGTPEEVASDPKVIEAYLGRRSRPGATGEVVSHAFSDGAPTSC
jgi:branched-chain amino acid transport system permease protein